MTKKYQLDYIHLKTYLADEHLIMRYLEIAIWGLEGAICPKCGSRKHYEIMKRNCRKQCSDCRYQYSVITNHPLFHNAKLKIEYWLKAIILLHLYNKDLTIVDLAKHLEINYHTAKKLHLTIKATNPAMLDQLVNINNIPKVLPKSELKFWEFINNLRTLPNVEAYLDYISILQDFIRKRITEAERKFYKNIGQKIEKLKRKHEDKDTELSLKLGVTLRQLLKYKTARNRINGPILYKIANLYDVPITYFLED